MMTFFCNWVVSLKLGNLPTVRSGQGVDGLLLVAVPVSLCGLSPCVCLTFCDRIITSGFKIARATLLM